MAFTALLDLYGGYGAGRQQRVQNQQQQEIIDAQKQAAAERAKIDAANLQQLNLQNQQYGADRSFESKLQYPTNWAKLTPQQQIAYLMVRQNNALRVGDTDIATATNQQIKDLQAGQITPRDLFSQQEQDRRVQYNQEMQNRREDQRISYEQWARQQPTYRDLHESPYEQQRIGIEEERLRQGGRGRTVTSEQADAAQSKWYEDWGKLTQPKPQVFNGIATGKMNPPSIPPAQAAAVGKKFSAIDSAQDPSALARALAAKEPNPVIKSFLLSRARWVEMERSSQGGGSDDSQNPTRKAPKVSQADIWTMLRENGATPEEATTLTAVAIAESGGNPGAVNPTDNNGAQTSWGLFQISDGTHNEPRGWNDPEVNTKMAIQKLRSQGLKAWGTYNTGAYRQYLPQGSG